MPILNKILLLRVVLVVLIATGGLFGLHYFQSDRVPQALLWQANAAVEKGKTDKAILYMRQYLEFVPDDYDNAVKLADLVLDRAVTIKDYTNAHFLYERVLREAPSRTDVGRKLVTLCIKMDRTADALIHAEKLLQQAPKDGILLGQVGECYAAQGRPDDARKKFEEAIGYAPENVRAYEQYAKLLLRHFNKPKEAEVVLDRLVAANSNRVEAYLIRSRFLKGDNQAERCLKDLDKVLFFDPENAEALINSAEIYQGRGEIRRAKETLQDAIATYPRDPRGYRSLSWLNLLTGNQAEAMACLQKGVELNPEVSELLTPLGDLYAEQNDLDRVQEVIRKLETQKNAKNQVNYLRSRMLMKQNKWNEALTTLEALRTETIAMQGLTTQLNLLIAACQEHRGDREAQFDSLKRILSSDPQNLASRVAMGNAYLNMGRLEEAIREYQVAIKSPFAGFGVFVTYANLRLTRAKRNGADEAEWKSLIAMTDDLRKQNKHAIDPISIRADIDLARGDFAGAERLLREEVTKRPEDPRLWSILANTIAQKTGIVAAMEILGEAQAAIGDSVELRLARSRLWLDDVQPDRSARIAKQEEQSILVSDAERRRLLMGMLEIYTQLRDEPSQKRIAMEMASRNAGDILSRKTLLAIALREGDVAAQSRLKQQLNKILGEKNSTVAMVQGLHDLEVSGLSEQKINELETLTRVTLQEIPDDQDAHLLAARIADRRGDLATASKHYDFIADMEPGNLRFQEARLSFLLKKGSEDQAKQLFRRLESDPRINGTKFRCILEGVIATGGPTALTKCINWTLEASKQKPRQMLWASRMLELNGNQPASKAYYQSLTGLHSKFADGWSSRLRTSLANGQDEMNRILADAGMALDRKAYFCVCAENATAIRSKIANWSPVSSRPEDRKAYAQATVSVCEARSQLEAAVPVLKSIAEDEKAKPEDVMWAKRSLAAITAVRGTDEERRVAINTLRSSNPAVKDSLEEARSRISSLTVVFRTASGDDRRAIINEMTRLLNEIVRDPASTANDWFHLAQLYRAAGDKSSCRRCFVELMKRDPNNLFFIAVNVDDLLSENRLEEAKEYIPKLMDGVHDVRVTGSLSRYFTLANEVRIVLDVVDRFVRSVDPGSADGALRQRQAAELLDQLTRLAASKGVSGYKQLEEGACDRYRASLKNYPDAVVQMSALLAFDGQVQRAFDELEKQKSRLSPPALALAGVGVLRGGHADAKQFQIVKSWIEEVLTETPDSLPMKLNLAELNALRQDFATAEKIYREVLKVDPKNHVALNNLAWILAPNPESAEQALKFADRAIELYGASGEMLDTRARILIAAGKVDRAVVDLNDAINQTQTPLRYFHLAVAQIKQSKMDDAVKTFREARSRGLDPKAIHPSDLPTYKQLMNESGSTVN